MSALARRDLAVVRGSGPVLVPLIVVPVVMLVVVPLVVGIVLRSADLGGAAAELGAFLSALPGDVEASLPSNERGRLGAATLVYLLAPLYLLVPVMVATVIAADSIAGERERGTLEALLLSPITDRELLVAKLAAAWLPAVAIAVVGAVAYGVVVELVLAPLTAAPLFPNLLWTLLALWVSPALAAAALGAVVLVSARVDTFQEASQLGGLVVLPIVALVVGQATGVLLLSPLLLVVGGVVMWLVAALLVRSGARAVRRTRLGERL